MADAVTGPRGRPTVLHVAMPTTAGVPTVLMGYLRDQLARGWSVGVACPTGTGWLAEAAERAGARVYDWPATRSPTPATAAEALRLARLVRAVRPHLVHLHSAKAGLAGRSAVRGRVPTVFQPHAWSYLAAAGPARRAAQSWERFGARWTDALLCVSRAERDDGLAHGVRCPSFVVPNGVDCPDEPADHRERTAARARLGLPDAPLAVCAGRLCEQKGQRDLLAAWDQLHAQVPRARLVLLGDGPDRIPLTELARQRDGIALVGERRDVTEWLVAADVVVVPSRWEGMALAPLEAMAQGRSVVATAVGGTRESVPDEAGAVVRPGDHTALARALAGRLTDRARADAEGRAGHHHVRRHHDAGTAARAVAEIYAELLCPAGATVPGQGR